MQLKWTDKFTWGRAPIRFNNIAKKLPKIIAKTIRIIWVKKVGGV